MPKFNDIDLKNWRESEIWTDSLWIIPERDKSGKHSGFYHGNFVPQIPRQLIQRYTKKGEYVLDPFLGSGTTAFEAEVLERNIIGIDIQPKLVNYVQEKIGDSMPGSYFFSGDSTSDEAYKKVSESLRKHGRSEVQLVVLHPPYADIIKFSELEGDLSNLASLDVFFEKFALVVRNCAKLLEEGRYLAVVIGDTYKQSQWIPLGFMCMNEVLKQGLILKSIVVKNMAGNRAKQSSEPIWRYRALASDYYIFKHEYIMIFKK